MLGGLMVCARPKCVVGCEFESHVWQFFILRDHFILNIVNINIAERVWSATLAYHNL
jgi:hypothetical protein